MVSRLFVVLVALMTVQAVIADNPRYEISERARQSRSLQHRVKTDHHNYSRKENRDYSFRYDHKSSRFERTLPATPGAVPSQVVGSNQQSVPYLGGSNAYPHASPRLRISESSPHYRYQQYMNNRLGTHPQSQSHTAYMTPPSGVASAPVGVHPTADQAARIQSNRIPTPYQGLGFATVHPDEHLKNRVGYPSPATAVKDTIRTSPFRGNGSRYAGRMMFNRFDRDGDGTLTSSEVSIALWDEITYADINRDSRVSRQELESQIDTMQARAAASPKMHRRIGR